MSTSYEQMICNKNDGAPELHANSSSNIDAIDAITEGMDSVAILDNSGMYDQVPKEVCASCGKEGNSDDMNTCNKCKSVKYCNAACKKKHRSKHKKACERRVAELYDDQLFKDHPPNEDCPICMLPLQHDNNTSTFKSCCGKMICNGCIYAMLMTEGEDIYPFCRMPHPSSVEEQINSAKKLVEVDNANACFMLACSFATGNHGTPQDYQKANELFLKAGELGCDGAYFNLGQAYLEERGVEKDLDRAKYYWELAAMNGSVNARHNLGCIEYKAGNYHRAYKHFFIAARAGGMNALDEVKRGFTDGILTKDVFANCLRTYHERQKEMKSDARDKAAFLKEDGKWDKRLSSR